MKRIVFLSLTFILYFFAQTNAQSPEGFTYQAVIRANDGEVIASKKIGLQASILQGSAAGSAVYTETFEPSTSDFGLVNLMIGSGNASNGTFSNIDWANGPYFLEIALDTDGGTNYQVMGASQLASVPYALHATTVEEESQELSVEGNTLSISGGNSVQLPLGSGGDGSTPVLKQLTAEEINALTEVVTGTMVYCTTNDVSYIRSPDGWREITEFTDVDPFIVYAGENQEICGLTGQLNAIPFPNGTTGVWSSFNSDVASVLADINDPKTTFTLPERNRSYSFSWSALVNGQTFEKTIEVFAVSPPVNTLIDNTSTLSTEIQITDDIERGGATYEILSGNGGAILDQGFAVLRGVPGETYLIKQTVTNICGSTEATTTITIQDPADVFDGVVNGRFTIPDPKLSNALKTLNVTGEPLITGNSLDVNAAIAYNNFQIFFDNSQITNLDGIQFFIKVQEMFIGQSAFTDLPNDFDKLNLRNLFLLEGVLTTIPNEIFTQENLERLDLTNHSIASIPANISNLTRLKTLNLSDNQLSTIANEIWSLTSLEELNLSFNNGITSISPQITNLTNLVRLNVQGTSLTATQINDLKAILPAVAIISDFD